MTADQANTGFAPAARSSQGEILRQAAFFAAKPDFKLLVDFVPDPLLVLNENRQIVFANTSARSIVSSSGHDEVLGLRPGEALNCRHSGTSVCGCGTSTFCRYCGAVRAILSSLRGEETVEECRLTKDEKGDSFLFLAHATPYFIRNESFVLFLLRDITSQSRREMLERIFFHDIKNTLTALNGWVSLLGDESNEIDQTAVFRTVKDLNADLIDEIQAQEQILKAENRTLAAGLKEISPDELITEICDFYRKMAEAENKSLRFGKVALPCVFRTDPSLIKRILGNMVKNALEATPPGGEVILKSCAQDGQMRFEVHNQGFMPPEVQSHVFKISFSTKGKGRGLGTYSMRLLSERYLSGSVTFVSSPETGTTFIASFPIG